MCAEESSSGLQTGQTSLPTSREGAASVPVRQLPPRTGDHVTFGVESAFSMPPKAVPARCIESHQQIDSLADSRRLCLHSAGGLRGRMAGAWHREGSTCTARSRCEPPCPDRRAKRGSRVPLAAAQTHQEQVLFHRAFVNRAQSTPVPPLPTPPQNTSLHYSHFPPQRMFPSADDAKAWVLMAALTAACKPGEFF